jgi:hypothetical protein|tara:strand:- start:710 stop:874 length:165 start_codon:yes stop_codon:yes gene_type:complete
MNQVKIRKIVKTRKRETITKESKLTMNQPSRTQIRIKSRKQKISSKLKKLSNKS